MGYVIGERRDILGQHTAERAPVSDLGLQARRALEHERACLLEFDQLGALTCLAL